MRPGKISTMPDKLVDVLKDRQQFLDLLRYVLDVRERGPANNVVISDQVGKRRLSPELEGLLLIQELNCVACHESQLAETGVAANVAPNLNWSREQLNPRYLAEFIADPHGIKPGTNMPDVLQYLGKETAVDSANAIVHFLQADINNSFRSQVIDADSVSRGNDLFHSVGCVACHSPRDAAASEMRLEDSIPLGALSRKYSVNALVEFLKNPCAIRPSGRMPDLKLSDREANDVAGYLLQDVIEENDRWTTDATLASQGKMLFAVLGCASCHTQVVKSNRQIPRPPALEKSKPDQGCLSGKTGNWPNFHLNQRQIELIRIALKKAPLDLTGEQKVAVAMRTFNCIACHNRGELAGVTVARDPHFQTTNLNLGAQGRIPPTLTGVGAKLKPEWMQEVLVNGRSIRPYMKTRMPQYGEENIGHLVGLLQKIDKVPAVTHTSVDDQTKMRDIGLKLTGNKGLNCIACHTYKQKLSDTMPAVDLTEMADRLKKDWFYHYMLAPEQFSPNTVMPSYWPGGTVICKEFEGDPSFQVEAIWRYLSDGKQMGKPSSSMED
jgi:mono/diheme cytochrome c family protein